MGYKVFGVITLAILGWVGWSIFNLAQSAQADGTILSISRSGTGDACCRVEVEFRDEEGELQTFRSDSGGDRQQETGDRVTVYYDSNDPTDANTFKGLIVGPAVLGFAALITAMFSWVLWRAKRKRDKSDSERT